MMNVNSMCVCVCMHVYMCVYIMCVMATVCGYGRIRRFNNPTSNSGLCQL